MTKGDKQSAVGVPFMQLVGSCAPSVVGRADLTSVDFVASKAESATD